jgi:uncharacterized protein (TIGR02246 family)
LPVSSLTENIKKRKYLIENATTTIIKKEYFMKALLASVLTMFLSVGTVSMAAVPAPDDAEIQALGGQFDIAWSLGDSAAIGNLFTESATMLTPLGERLEGRAAIQAVFQKWMESAPQSKHETKLTYMTHLTPDMVLIDGDCILSGLKDSAGTLLPNSVSSFSAILIKVEGKWYIAHNRAYLFQAPVVPGN